MSRYPFDMEAQDLDAVQEGVSRYRSRQEKLEEILRTYYAPPAILGLREGQHIRPYQVQAIELVRSTGRLLLGDEGGLGKTYTAAGFLCSEPSSLPAAVVCDPHMQKQWKEKIEAFTTLRVHLIKKRSAYELPPADVYVFRISQVEGWVDIFATGYFKAAVFDEPQSLRTGQTTNKGQACKTLSDNVLFRLGLTATPVYNYGDEIWQIMQYIDETALGSWGEFAREWCTAVGSRYRVADPKALGSFMREQHLMLRRLKADVGLQLPRVSKIVEHINYDQNAVNAVEDLARQLAIKATTGSFVERGSAVRKLDIMMRQATGVAKAKSVAFRAAHGRSRGESHHLGMAPGSI